MRGFKRAIASDMARVREALDEAMAYIRAAAAWISREDEMDLKLVLSELLLNAAIHGNLLDDRKRVVLTLRMDGEALTVCVEDEGDGFDYQQLLDGFGTPDFESEHGRGVRLACALMDQFSFNGKGNRVTCSKRVRGTKGGVL